MKLIAFLSLTRLWKEIQFIIKKNIIKMFLSQGERRGKINRMLAF